VVEASSKDCAKDRRALATILHTMPSEMKAGLAMKKSVKEAWDAVMSMRVGDDHVKSASLQHLLKEYTNVLWRGVRGLLRDAHQQACRQPARTWRGDGG
jgi:hypothetical protein